MALRVRAFRPAFVAVSLRQLTAVGEGITASGDDFAFTDNLQESADVALVVSGEKFPGSALCAARAEINRRFNGRILVSETPFFRKGAQPHEGPNPYFRLSVGGFLRDDGKFHPDGFRPDTTRWVAVKGEQTLELAPWHSTPDGSVLVTMQKPSDASLRGTDVRRWTQSTILQIWNTVKRPIVVRAHPLDPRRAGLDISDLAGTRWSTASLEDDLAESHCVVTYTSLSAIEAVMAGVPTFCMSDANHAWDVSLKDDLSVLVNDSQVGREPDRQAWVDGLSWGQWRLTELREGTPWRRLRPLLT